MHTQAINTSSRLTLFTSLYGFMRIAAAGDEWLHLSNNVMKGTGDSDELRRQLRVNLRIVQEFFFFVFGAVAEAYGAQVILPPSFLQEYKPPTYTQFNSLASALTLQEYLRELIGVKLFRVQHWAWKMVLKICGPRLLTYGGSFCVPNIHGTFKRHNQRQAVCLSIVSSISADMLVVYGFPPLYPLNSERT